MLWWQAVKYWHVNFFHGLWGLSSAPHTCTASTPNHWGTCPTPQIYFYPFFYSLWVWGIQFRTSLRRKNGLTCAHYYYWTARDLQHEFNDRGVIELSRDWDSMGTILRPSNATECVQGQLCQLSGMLTQIRSKRFLGQSSSTEHSLWAFSLAYTTWKQTHQS